MSTRPFAAALCLWLLASNASAQGGPQPGDLVPGFGDGDGYKRIDFTDIAGPGSYDSGRSIVLIRSPLGVVQKILVAGIAGGNRFGIVQLNANGSGDQTFGSGGRALSTRTNVRDFAGMVRMPNGDIVVGYSDDYSGTNDSKDFFIEVFTAAGQPKAIGGPEVANQQYVDLSTSNPTDLGICNNVFRNAEATAMTVTEQGNVLIVGEQALTFNGNAVDKIAFAEFSAGTYAPARPAWGFRQECRTAGAGLGDPTYGAQIFGHARDVWAGAGGSVHVSGRRLSRPTGPAFKSASQTNVVLGADNGLFSTWLPSGFWEDAESSVNRIMLDPTGPGILLMFGERAGAAVGGGFRFEPLVALSQGQGPVMFPRLFLQQGPAAAATVALRDGARFPNSSQFWVLGSAAACEAGNNCARNYDSWVAGVSTGVSNTLTYESDLRFGDMGWVRKNVPGYDQVTPTTRSFAWRAALSRPTSALLATDLYVVGDFAFDQASGDYDWFVAKLRIFNSEAIGPIDALFADGFE